MMLLQSLKAVCIDIAINQFHPFQMRKLLLFHFLIMICVYVNVCVHVSDSMDGRCGNYSIEKIYSGVASNRFILTDW